MGFEGCESNGLWEKQREFGCLVDKWAMRWGWLSIVVSWSSAIIGKMEWRFEAIYLQKSGIFFFKIVYYFSL